MSKKQQLLTVIEAAKMLGITRAAVYKKINKGQVAVQKIGGHIFISFPAKGTTAATKTEIDKGVAKTIKEYSETLKMLGKE